MNTNSKGKIYWKIIKALVSWTIIIALLIYAYKIFSKSNFNDYTRAEYKNNLSEFYRDENVKYSNMNSYKIENTDYNDAMFFKKIDVVPNTSYKVTCMIKTENVVNKELNTDAGAHICINESTEKSDNVTGTTDWTKVEFIFNSKNRQEVEIGFRLGGNNYNSIGTAWFSDMKIESGTAEISNKWNFLCLIFNNTNVDIDLHGEKKNYDLSLSREDVEDMKTCMGRFKNSISELSKNKINVTYDLIEISEPITSMSYDEANGYYVSPYDVKNVIDKYIKMGKYDHIFIAFRTGIINSTDEIPVNDWIGLGGMEYRNIGFSNIRLPNNGANYIYKYDERVNIFPEEVYVHEFLHTLERNAEEYGYERPELHSYSNFGYANQTKVGLKSWYADYMNKEIETSSGKLIGLPEEIFDKKPSKTSDFNYPKELNDLNEPANIFEEMRYFFVRIGSFFQLNKIEQ